MEVGELTLTKPISQTVTRTTKPRVLMALSGGIDSAVSAQLLLEQGYEVEAAFMKNWSDTTGLKLNECPWLQDRQDAMRVAAFLRIPLRTIDFEKEYTERVMSYFFEEYKNGRTPNPDVMCNKEIKFKLLYDWAMAHGFEYIATGHYARVAQLKGNGGEVSFSLQRSADEFKDQTYFIYNIKTEQLPHILFPIGGMQKSDVRMRAQELNLPNADKKESMGLCFVGKIRLKDFLEQQLKPQPGLIVDRNGLKVGEHEGLHNYTIGQRQGIRIGGDGGPWYVAQKLPVDNLLVVTNDPEDEILQIREIQIHSTNWINFDPANLGEKQLMGRYRHQGELVKVILSPVSSIDKNDQYYKVVFDEVQLAVASGQSLVLYDGDLCVGGGVIV